MLKLMYITNDTEVARIAEKNGVDRIFIDMEYIGKSLRQGGMDTVQNNHTIDDVRRVRQVIKRAKLMVRCNPIHDKTEKYGSSKEEIDSIIEAGADIIMLPYFKSVEEVRRFLSCVDKRVKTILLVETPEAVDCLDEILELDHIDEFFVGLNDLSIGYGKKFMFELLADGTVEKLCLQFRLKGLPYGFGGIASLGKGLLPAERIIAEHYRLGSTCAILSRSFCNMSTMHNMLELNDLFAVELSKIREHEKMCNSFTEWLWINQREVVKSVQSIAKPKYEC